MSRSGDGGDGKGPPQPETAQALAVHMQFTEFSPQTCWWPRGERGLMLY